MKKVFLIFISVLLLMSFSGCNEQKVPQPENFVSSIEDVQGFWYEEGNTGLLMGFKGEEYILYGFGTQISVTGTFEVEDHTIIVHTEKFGDKIYESAKIENGILSLKTSDGQISHWKNISEDEVRRMLSEDNSMS